MFLYIFYKGIQFNKSLYFLLVISFTILAGFDAFVFNKLYAFNGMAKPIESLVFTIVALYFYYFNLNQNNTVSIFNQPMYWYTTGVLIYFSINFFMFLLMNPILINSTKDTEFLEYNVHSLSNIVANVLFAISFTRFNERVK
jgi:hypothetical protein